MKKISPKVLISALVLMNSAIAAETVSKKEYDELVKRIENLEYKDYERSYKINGTLINHFESYYGNVKDDGDGNSSHEKLNLAGTLFQLNVNFDVTERLKVYSRLGMSKFWNNSNTGGNGKYNRSESDDTWDASNTGSYGYQGATPQFDRAYMSYQLTSTSTLALGRMPTNGGPPSQYLDGLDRQGTYPRFGYNAIFDGAAFVYNFKKFLNPDHQLSARLFYTPFTFVDSSSRTNQREETDPNTSDTVRAKKSLTPQYTFLLDYESSRWKEAAKKLYLSYFWYNYSDFYQYVPNDGIYNYQATAHMAYLAMEGVRDTGLNLGLSWLYVNGRTKNYADGADRTVTYSNAQLYHLNYRFKNNHVLGLEHIKTDETFYLDEWSYYTVNDFYRVPNNSGFHYYYALPVLDNSVLRVGVYSYQKEKSSSPDADQSAKNVSSVYASIRTDF